MGVKRLKWQKLVFTSRLKNDIIYPGYQVERYARYNLKIGDKMEKSIIDDSKFRHRFGLKGVSSAITGQRVLGEAKWKGAKTGHVWTLSEWSSRHLFLDEMSEEVIDGGINFCNEAKSVRIYPGKGKISLALDSRKEYDGHRKEGETWVHLLLEQAIPMEKRVPLDKIDKLFMELAVCISKCDIHMMPEEFKPGLHTAQVSWFLTVENCKGKVFDIEGRPDYMWFGVPVFDYRYNKVEGPQVFLDHGTKKVIYGMNRGDFLPEPVEIGKEYKFKIDVLPEIRRAFDIAKRQGWLKGASWTDMAVGSMNLGWEIPGTFDCDLDINKIGITYIPVKDEQ